MSTSSTVARPVGVGSVVRRAPELRLFRSELRLVLRRRRNIALVAVLCCFPVLIGVAVKLSAPSTDGAGPPFLSQVTDNGLFLVFTSLTVLLPFFLPLAVSVAAGEAIAGEANIGTLRNLLVVPVSRTRLLMVKFFGSVVFAFLCTVSVALVGVVVGLVLFPHGAVTLLSGATISYGDALWRGLLVAGYVTLMLAGLCGIGMFVSTLTEGPIGACLTYGSAYVAASFFEAVARAAPAEPTFVPTVTGTPVESTF